MPFWPLAFGCALTDCDLKNLWVCTKKTKTVGLLKNVFMYCFSLITNEVPVTILFSCIPIPRHIRKGVLIRLIIAFHLCTAVGCHNLCKESRKFQTRIIFERYYSFFCYCLLSCRNVMLRKSILCKPKWGWGGAQEVVRGARPPPPGPP